jgi:hypothetical protein
MAAQSSSLLSPCQSAFKFFYLQPKQTELELKVGQSIVRKLRCASKQQNYTHVSPGNVNMSQFIHSPVRNNKLLIAFPDLMAMSDLPLCFVWKFEPHATLRSRPDPGKLRCLSPPLRHLLRPAWSDAGSASTLPLPAGTRCEEVPADAPPLQLRVPNGTPPAFHWTPPGTPPGARGRAAARCAISRNCLEPVQRRRAAFTPRRRPRSSARRHGCQDFFI